MTIKQIEERQHKENKLFSVVLPQMKKLEEEHPKARIEYDSIRDEISVIYPLPKDFLKLKRIYE